jgi:hypothetical protein
MECKGKRWDKEWSQSNEGGCPFYRCDREHNWHCNLGLRVEDCDMLVDYIAGILINRAINNIFRTHKEDK